jgi:hypothetical protein
MARRIVTVFANGIWIIMIPTSFSTGSIQNVVPQAPVQWCVPTVSGREFMGVARSLIRS